jgi:hypothetical protein
VRFRASDVELISTREHSTMLSRRCLQAVHAPIMQSRMMASTRPPTAVLMMNMGGPSEPEETQEFLKRLFTDNDIIELGGSPFPL